jgi:hypothetical protein
MAHEREYFPTLADSNDVGVALSKSQAGDDAAGKIGSTAFTFKDSSGNLVLPTLTSEGKIPVDFAGAGVSKSACADASGDGFIAGSLTEQTICEITLTANKTYGKITVSATCFRESIYRLVQLDNTTETTIATIIVGPGQYSAIKNLGETEIVAGSTGTQKLILKGYNLQKVSDMGGEISCLEFAS